MTDDRFRRLEKLFHRARELPQDERRSFLEQECSDDDDLLHRVEQLLAYEQHGEGVEPGGILRRGGEGPGSRIGPYKLIRELGQGGMGVVYEAEQEQPVRRRVALKLIRRGMDSDRIVARFEAERQALALMDHPAIARVFDAGQADDGRPYFVMELVDGLPVTEHCDRHKLTTKDRLQLFVLVCAGVQHAHQKAIIHRDLKPSNVLVTVQDGKAVPKIIDFGVAKAVEQPLTERTLFTELGVLVGTPTYMSPEQADLTGRNVDTRTDVYALGVLLYELLTGVLPFDPEQLRLAGFEEIVRKIREDDPPRPSSRISAASKQSTLSAKNRKTEPGTLTRRLRGDLDWITMRALEKDRSRRYASASELAADVERHLRDEPVVAGPPSALYRLRKTVRRNRVAFVAALVVIVVLVAGLAGTAAGLVRAKRAEALARAEAEKTAREAEASREISEFLTDLFAVSDPGESRGNSITAREILDRGVERIRGDLEEQPLVQGRLMNTMGEVYMSLGLYNEARPLFEEALEQRRNELGELHADVGTSYANLGRLLRLRNEPDEAQPLLEKALEIREAVLGPEHKNVAASLNDLSLLMRSKGDLVAAGEYLERSLAVVEADLGPDHSDVAVVRFNLGALLIRQGELEASKPHIARAIEITESELGADHPRVGVMVGTLAYVERNTGQLAAARVLYERSLEIQKKVNGPDHPDVGITLHNLSFLYRDLGLYDEGLRGEREALRIFENALDREHALRADALTQLGVLADKLGDHEAAREWLETALDFAEQAWGGQRERYAGLLLRVGTNERHDGQLDRAREYIARASAVLEEDPAKNAYSLALISLHAALVEADAGRAQDAAAFYDAAILGFEEHGERDQSEVAELRASYWAALGAHSQALDLLEQAVQAGHANAGMIRSADLAPLRDEPRFAELTRVVQARLEHVPER